MSFLLSYEPRQRETYQLAKQLICRNKQKSLYAALVKYQEREGEVPNDLMRLALEGYCTNRDLSCSISLSELSPTVYRYYPRNFGKANAVLLSDDYDNQTTEKIWHIIETMGDGKVVEAEISKNP
jgi:type VI protein secretion system component VasA